ncbi:MAG: hypothetical protein WDM71_02730 [Ferruginibacter sp.]
MTYAYAMVLENGAHISKEQPMFSATLKTTDSIITLRITGVLFAHIR